MLRHSRAETYAANKKYKERDKTHGHALVHGCSCGLIQELTEASYIKRNRFNLRDYLKRAWNIQI
jgi:hypothetical protein